MDINSKTDILISSNQRIEFIDAMRGFTMILVVVCHVAGFCLGIQDDVPSIHPYLYEFRMPTFFFISGFVLYKSTEVWNIKYVLSFLRKKFPVQIVTTFIFFIIFVYIHGENLGTCLFTDSKSGYWFTYTLFFYFVFYSFIRWFLYMLRCNDIITDAVVLFSGIIFYMSFSVRSIFYSLPVDQNISALLSMSHWGYFLFFIIGTLFKKYYVYLQLFLDKNIVIFLFLLIFFGANVFYEFLLTNYQNLLNLSTAISGVVLIFTFFRINHSSFVNEKTIGRCLQYIGRRTLDVYLLHYFFLPVGLLDVSSVLRNHPMPLIEFVITLVISLVVIAGCLIFSKILRMSPTMSYLLFGVKKHQ